MSIKSIVGTIGHDIAAFVSGFFNNDLKPWLNDLLTHVKSDVIDALVPIAHEVIQEVLDSGGKLLAGASVHDVAAGAGTALASLAKRAEAAGIQAAGHDLITALGAALNNRNALDAGTSVSSPKAT